MSETAEELIYDAGGDTAEGAVPGSKPAAVWRGIPGRQWDDWKWQVRNRVMNCEQLSRVISLRNDEKEDIESCLERFKMAVTPYYASLMDPCDKKCPIRMQAVPSASEMDTEPCEMDDPVGEEKFSPTENIVHRYPDRVLFILTHKCSMYCRHCTRRRIVGGEDFTASTASMEKAFDYIGAHKEIRDVLLSGGDPLMLSDARLESIIMRLRQMPHVEVIRIGTRVPVVLPMRITGELVGMLRKYHPIWINTHFNHPKEITPESSKACEMIADAGIPLGNQSVLLKGINNDAGVLKELFTKLVKIRVRPYYLYQCDIAKGIGHFRTPVSEGIELMRQIRGYISGYAVPVFVIDAPGGGGKTPINPEYLVSLDENKAVIKNYLGQEYTYTNPLNTRPFRAR